MFQKGDILKVGGLQLKFLEDARQLGDPALGRITYGGRACPAQDFGGEKYYIKYVGAFDTDGDRRYINRVQSRWNMISVQGSRAKDLASPFLAETAAYGTAVCGRTDVNVLVLHYAEGISLSQRIRELNLFQKQPDRRAKHEALRLRLDLIRQLLFGIRDYSQGEDGTLYVHRDLKPDNIRVQVWKDDGGRTVQQLRILDFDMLLSSGEMPERGGTAGYTHPALYFGYGLEETDMRRRFSWDLYSAGMLAYYILEGKECFTEEEFEKQEKNLFRLGPMWIERKEKEYSYLYQILRDMVQKEQVRYFSIDQVIADFQTFLKGYYGDRCSRRMELPHYLECIPGYEGKRKPNPVICQVKESNGTEEDDSNRLPSYRSFMVYDGTLCRLSYGDGGNLGGAFLPYGRIVIGVFSFLSEDQEAPLRFIPYSDNVSIICDGRPIPENKLVTERVCQLDHLDQILYSHKGLDGKELWRVEITILKG